ncbi:MAG: GNAT family N-acetyltransferase [Rhodanobacteraceae bacterium]
MRNANDELVTERLRLRRFVPADVETVVRLNADPRVMQYISGPKTREESERMFADRVLGYYDEHPGLGVWATLERASGECIGLHLLNHIQGESIIQLGYVLFPQFWGRGYATEMGIAILRYGFVELGLPRVAGITDLPNTASQRVLEKCGLRRDGERSFAHPAYVGQGPLAWFEREADDWLADSPKIEHGRVDA